jgi:sensor histidine kinase YesM
MLLQPIVENSIRHGLSSKVEGGTIHLRSSVSEGRLQILVETTAWGFPKKAG